MISYYTIPAAIYSYIALIYGVLYVEQFDTILDAKVFTWTHMFTLGILFPLYAGFALYKTGFYFAKLIDRTLFFIHFILHQISLPFFLYALFSTNYFLLLYFSASGVFLSVFIWIIIFYRATRKKKEIAGKLPRWISMTSLFFLFQAIMFGLLLVANMEGNWFRSSIVHSIKLHSHSAISGFFLILWAQLVHANSSGIQAARNEKIVKYFYYGLYFFLFFSLILWTAVHDQNPVIFQLVFAANVTFIVGVSAWEAILTFHKKLKFVENLLLFIQVLFISAYIFKIIYLNPPDDSGLTNYLVGYGFLVFYGLLYLTAMLKLPSLTGREENEMGQRKKIFFQIVIYFLVLFLILSLNLNIVNIVQLILVSIIFWQIFYHYYLARNKFYSLTGKEMKERGSTKVESI